MLVGVLVASLSMVLIDMCSGYHAKIKFIKPDYVCEHLEHMCKDGTCVDYVSDCKGRGGSVCKETQRYCTERGCLPRQDPEDLCSHYCGKCFDGSMSCSSDGKTCPGVCPLHMTMCNGICTEGYSCKKAPCRDYVCDDGKCYSAPMRCDGYSFCEDSTDERGCAYPNRHLPNDADKKSSGNSTLYMVALVLCVVFVTLFSICVTVFKRSRPDIAAASGGIDFPDESHFTETRIELVRVPEETPMDAEVDNGSPSPLVPTAPPPYNEAVDTTKYPPPATAVSAPPSSDQDESPPRYTYT